MAKSWRHQDLGGGGLQAANLRLARLLKRRAFAYALLALFPLGLHRLYLRDHRGALAYVAATLAAVGAILSGSAPVAMTIGVALLIAAIYDAARCDRRITALNKEIRKAVLLGQGATPPSGYRGRPTNDVLSDYLRAKDKEPIGAHIAAGDAPIAASNAAISTLAEQERQLRVQARDPEARMRR